MNERTLVLFPWVHDLRVKPPNQAHETRNEWEEAIGTLASIMQGPL